MVTTQVTKRKKTADMADSLPKRVTRARAAKTVDDDDEKPKATKITTASAKAAAVSKAVAPAKVTKRKTRADHGDVVTHEEVAAKQPKSEPVSAEAQRMSHVAVDKEGIMKAEVPKVRGRAPKAAPVENLKPEASKPRGRPKKTADPAPSASETQENSVKPGPVKKATRGRAATGIKTSAATTTAKPAAPAAKKRVKFEDVPEKENIPLETTIPKNTAMKLTGLKAKPIRKPAAARATTRGRKTTKASERNGQEDETKPKMPLSPKKVNQMANTGSMTSEDELAGDKTPVRALSISPTRRILSPTKHITSVSNLDFGVVNAPSSPSKAVSAEILASPARRPPPSPFKDALKNTPKKLDLGDSIAHPMLLSSRTPTKVSLLQESPKRGIHRDFFTQPILVPSKSPFKTSLLQSPARRPTASPKKEPMASGSPEKSVLERSALNLVTSPKRSSPSRVATFSPQISISSPFRAARSREHAFKVHTITGEERKADQAKNDFPEPELETPVMQGDGAEDETSAQMLEITRVDPTRPDEAMEVEKPSSMAGENAIEESPHPVEAPPTLFTGPAFSLGSPALRRISIESGSEDELASPEKGYAVTRLRKNGIPAIDFDTPAVSMDQNSELISNDQLSFTPLVNQLSLWAASSPENQKATRQPRQARGMFSLGGAEVAFAHDQMATELHLESPAKTSFEDEMAFHVDHDVFEDNSYADLAVDDEQNLRALQVSQGSQASEEYGDENAVPPGADLLRAEQDEQDHTLTCTPAKVFTPAKEFSKQPREMHTVSKVPLRASADDSPLALPRQRSRSFGGPLAVVGGSLEIEAFLDARPATPLIAATDLPQTPSSGMRLDAETPGRTSRKGVVSDVLKGAVVYVDVHTSEGADASGIFVDLLTQMGARCLKQWSWNPRASMGNSLDSNVTQGAPPDPTTEKVGITHVIYKDGGKRTLEKVRSSNGAVSCVGVGWVLE